MSDMIYKELIKDMTWSYSRVSCFNDCRYRWFLRYIREDKEEPQFYCSYGSFMHELIEYYYNGIIDRDEMQLKFLMEFQNKVKGKRPAASTVQKYIKCGNEYIQNFTDFPYKTLGVEQEVNFKIGNHEFVGYIDYLGEKDGDIYLVDNKSRALKPRSNRKTPTVKDKELDSMLRQLYVYSAAVKELYGKFPEYLCFNCFRTNTFIKERFDIEKYNEAIEWVNNTIEEIENTDNFNPNIEYFMCSYICGLNNECCYWQER